MAKTPVKLSSVFAEEPETVELEDGSVHAVRPIDGVGYDLYMEMEADPSRGGNVWPIAQRCLPTASEASVKSLSPAECYAVIAIALGKVKDVQAWAATLPGNGEAPRTAEPQSSVRSQTPSDSSASALPASSASH